MSEIDKVDAGEIAEVAALGARLKTTGLCTGKGDATITWEMTPARAVFVGRLIESAAGSAELVNEALDLRREARRRLDEATLATWLAARMSHRQAFWWFLLGASAPAALAGVAALVARIVG